jgi:hypothetical protein
VLLARAGRQVAVVEARSIGAVTTGHSTAKVSLLQATALSKIVKNHSDHVAAAYLDGNRCRSAVAPDLLAQSTTSRLSSETPTPTQVRQLAPPPYGVSSTLRADSACQFR